MRHGEIRDQDRLFEVQVSVLDSVEVLHELNYCVARFSKGVLF